MRMNQMVAIVLAITIFALCQQMTQATDNPIRQQPSLRHPPLPSPHNRHPNPSTSPRETPHQISQIPGMQDTRRNSPDATGSSAKKHHNSLKAHKTFNHEYVKVLKENIGLPDQFRLGNDLEHGESSQRNLRQLNLANNSTIWDVLFQKFRMEIAKMKKVFKESSTNIRNATNAYHRLGTLIQLRSDFEKYKNYDILLKILSPFLKLRNNNISSLVDSRAKSTNNNSTEREKHGSSKRSIFEMKVNTREVPDKIAERKGSGSFRPLPGEKWRPPLQRPVNKVVVISGYGNKNPDFESQPGFGFVQGSDDGASDWWSQDVWSNSKSSHGDTSAWFQNPAQGSGSGTDSKGNTGDSDWWKQSETSNKTTLNSGLSSSSSSSTGSAPSSSSSSSSNLWGRTGSQTSSNLDSFSYNLWQSVADSQSSPKMTSSSSGFNTNNGISLTQQGGGFSMGQVQGGGSANSFVQGGGSSSNGLFSFGMTNSGAGRGNGFGSLTNNQVAASGGGLTGASSMGGGASVGLNSNASSQNGDNFNPYNNNNNKNNNNHNSNNGMQGLGAQGGGTSSFGAGSGFGGSQGSGGFGGFSSSSFSGMSGGASNNNNNNNGGSLLSMGMNPGFGGSQGNPNDNTAGMFFNFAQSQSSPGMKTGAGFGGDQGSTTGNTGLGSNPKAVAAGLLSTSTNGRAGSSGFPLQGMGSSSATSDGFWGATGGSGSVAQGSGMMTAGGPFQFEGGMSENNNAWQFSGMTNPGFSDPGFGGSQASGSFGSSSQGGSIFNFGGSPGFGESQGRGGGGGGNLGFGGQQSMGGGGGGRGATGNTFTMGNGGMNGGVGGSTAMMSSSFGGSAGSVPQGGSLINLIGNSSRVAGKLNSWLDQETERDNTKPTGNGKSPFSIPQFFAGSSSLSSSLGELLGSGPAFTGGPMFNANAGNGESGSSVPGNAGPWAGLSNAGNGPSANSGNPFNGGSAPFSGFTIGGGGQVSVPSSAAKFSFGEGGPSDGVSPNGNSPTNQGGANIGNSIAQGFPGTGLPFSKPVAGNNNNNNNNGGIGGQGSSPFASVVNSGRGAGTGASPFSSALSSSNPFSSGSGASGSSPFSGQMGQGSTPFSATSGSSPFGVFSSNNMFNSNPSSSSSSSNSMSLFGLFQNPSQQKPGDSGSGNPLQSNLFSQTFNFGKNDGGDQSGFFWMFPTSSDSGDNRNSMFPFGNMFQGSSNRMPSRRSYLNDFVHTLFHHEAEAVSLRSDTFRETVKRSVEDLLQNLDDQYIFGIVRDTCIDVVAFYLENGLEQEYPHELESQLYLKTTHQDGTHRKLLGISLRSRNKQEILDLCRNLTMKT